MNATYARVHARLLQDALLEPATTPAQWAAVLRFNGVERLAVCPDTPATLDAEETP